MEDTTPTKVITSMEALSMFSEQREITNASYLTSGKSFTARKKVGLFDWMCLKKCSRKENVFSR